MTTEASAERRAEAARRRRVDGDFTARVAQGVADGLAEASDTFSREFEGTTSCTDLLERSFTGFIRANARFMDELATVVREAGDDLTGRRRRIVIREDIDYERLADLVAERLREEPAVAESPD